MFHIFIIWLLTNNFWWHICNFLSYPQKEIQLYNSEFIFIKVYFNQAISRHSLIFFVFFFVLNYLFSMILFDYFLVVWVCKCMITSNSLSLSSISLWLPSPIPKPSLSPTHFYSSSYFSSPCFAQSGLMACLTSRAFPCCNLLDLFGPIPLLL